jgi:hypothetical protein
MANAELGHNQDEESIKDPVPRKRGREDNCLSVPHLECFDHPGLVTLEEGRKNSDVVQSFLKSVPELYEEAVTSCLSPNYEHVHAGVWQFLTDLRKSYKLRTIFQDSENRMTIAAEIAKRMLELNKDDEVSRRQTKSTPTMWEVLLALLSSSAETYHQQNSVLVLRCGGEHRENWLPNREPPENPVFLLALRGKGPSLLARCRIGNHPLDYLLDKKFIDSLSDAYSKKYGALIVVHGESGSGKTLGMIAIAVRHFQCDIVIHVDLSTILVGEKNVEDFVKEDMGEFCKLEKDAQAKFLTSKVIDRMTELLEAAKVCGKGGSHNVVLIIDEVGSFPPYIRRLCATHEVIAERLKTLLGVASVTIICGGTGADAQGLTGSTATQYLLWRVRPPEKERLLTWLTAQSKLAIRNHCITIHAWLTAPSKSWLATECLAMLNNWRTGTHLITELAQLELEDQLERHPRVIEECLRKAMSEYRKANGLRDLSVPEAINTLQVALAFETLAFQHPVVVDNTPIRSFRKLFTSLGVLTDTLPSAEDPVRVGEPRYAMSPALRLIAVQSFGLKGEKDPSGAKFENQMIRYFYFLFQAALLVPKLKAGVQDVNVLLRKDWHAAVTANVGTEPGLQVAPHGMQMQYPADQVTFLDATYDTLPLTKRGTKSSPSRCMSLCFHKRLQPPPITLKSENFMRKCDLLQKIAGGQDVSQLAICIQNELDA